MIKSIEKYQTIGIIGLAKNTGKTTTLNYLIELYKHEPLGLTSIGLDGEAIDQVNYLPKPRIDCYSGMILATAKECLDESTIDYEILEETNALTALGKVLIVRVISNGRVMLAGPTTNLEMNEILHRMKNYVSRIFVDGALSRMTFSALEGLDGIVLASGASFHQEMNETLSKTKHVIDLFMYPKTKIDINPNASYILSSGDEKIISDKKSYASLRLAFESMRESLKWLYVRGAITDKFLDMLIDLRLSSFTLIVEDPTKLLYHYRLASVIEKLKIQIEVLKTCKLFMITINPFRPVGRSYDPDVFLKEVKKLTSIPIINVKSLEDKDGNKT